MENIKIIIGGLLGLMLIGSSLKGQNLVPNASFENIALSHICITFGYPQEFERAVEDWLSPTKSAPNIFSTQISKGCWCHLKEFEPNSGASCAIFCNFSKKKPSK